ncbi:MAG: carbon-nitrogen hydrolase family protein [Puniceicoccales bacterium]|nr:carbon-nitrogen hydrolase family protein [Puniceicoccales bacterium]
MLLCCASGPVFAQKTDESAGREFDFTQSKGKYGDFPEGWTQEPAHIGKIPRFELRMDTEGTYLSISGSGDSGAVGSISTKTKLAPGTYAYTALFSFSEEVNPQRHLLFQCDTGTLGGIFKFYRLDNGQVEGRGLIVVAGDKPREVKLRIFYRFNPAGEVKLRRLSLTPTAPVKPRWVRFACTEGRLTDAQIPKVAEAAARQNADLLLYPEHVSQSSGDTSNGEQLQNLLSSLAAKHKMYVAASLLVIDKTDGRKYNRGVLYDRKGGLVGVYDKIHPYSPEIQTHNISPGVRTEIFKTEFGKLGMVICYDSWFTDVTELMALKGAEVILFPAAGYYRSLIPARAADNQVRFVISVLGRSYGIFDTAGRDVQTPAKDPSVSTSGKTFKDVQTLNVENIGVLCASLDLNCNISPHYNGGSMNEAPGGKRNRTEQVLYLDDEIKKEKERWWENE